jgi:Domain of unknown function (DUF4124)
LKPSNLIWALLLSALLPLFANAQALFKYTDKNGKVTYSDRQPKPGEKAERVNIDPNANIMTSSPAVRSGGSQALQEGGDRSKAKADGRATREEKIKAAEADLEKAKKALEDASQPSPEERTIRVGRDKSGKPTGVNVILPKPEYKERVEKLEADVKKAQEKLDEVRSSGNG